MAVAAAFSAAGCLFAVLGVPALASSCTALSSAFAAADCSLTLSRPAKTVSGAKALLGLLLRSGKLASSVYLYAASRILARVLLAMCCFCPSAGVRAWVCRRRRSAASPPPSGCCSICLSASAAGVVRRFLLPVVGCGV
ncbi:hypothetical protein PF010_g31857 [Phytophthora fragariae]|uniref:RxLR effector protein n=1 Tax=Phytophthora fragariae TaxID=53985 RepID=A0A6G0JGN6_9STRA|nr:hypothetical protein PF010_g31857 [Phytophthora fragariae]